MKIINSTQTGTFSVTTALVNRYVHYLFVIAPIKKANGNSAFISKRHYSEVLIKDFGIGRDVVASNRNHLHGIKKH